MVEDGHLPNSYQYGSKTYYLDDVSRKDVISDSRNNNDACVVVIESGRRDGESTDDETTTTTTDERNALNSTLYSAANPATSVVVAASSPSATLTDGVIANSRSAIAHSPLRYDDVRYSHPDRNGSSRVDGDGAPSQTFYDVTKKAIGNGGGGVGGGGGSGGGVLSGDEQQPFGGGGENGRATVVAAGYVQEIHKTAIAFGLLIFNFFLTTTSLAIIHDKVPDEGPLRDLILDIVEPHEWALQVSEVLIIVTTSIMLVIVVLHKYRFIILRRLFLMLSLLYFMRSITMFVTVLPVSSKTYHCSEKKNSTELCEVLKRSLSLFFGMGLTINGRHVYCGDYIYSGHTTILVMSYLMISEYSSRRLFWLHWATWTMSLTGVLMVLLSHSHYTVDVIIGYYVTTRLFWMYHTCANNQLLKKRSAYNYLAREWWFGLFQYFECNVRGPLMPYEHHR